MYWVIMQQRLANSLVYQYHTKWEWNVLLAESVLWVVITWMCKLYFIVLTKRSSHLRIRLKMTVGSSLQKPPVRIENQCSKNKQQNESTFCITAVWLHIVWHGFARNNCWRYSEGAWTFEIETQIGWGSLLLNSDQQRLDHLQNVVSNFFSCSVE